MSDITKKQTDLQGIVRNKEDMLLTRVQSFTSKEVSEACRGMDEKLLERTALMCERISTSREDRSKAALIIANLSKHKEGRDETINSIMEKLEESKDRLFFERAERLSKTLSPEKFLEAIPVMEILSKWDKRGLSPAIRIDESKVILATAELSQSFGDGLAQYMELGRMCVEKGVNPEHIFETLALLMKEHPTKEQFETVVGEMSKIIPNLGEIRYGRMPPLQVPELGEEKSLIEYSPEWILKAFSDKMRELVTYQSIERPNYNAVDEFIKYLKDYEMKTDPLQKAISYESGSEPYQRFKNELRSTLCWNAGAVAFAKLMAEDEDFCHSIESSLSDRKSKGYYNLFSYDELLDPIKMLNEFRAYEKKPVIPYYEPDLAEKTGGYPELKDITNLRYTDFKRITDSHPEIAGEVSALETIWKEYRQMFEDRVRTLTPTQDIKAEKAAEFLRSFLEITKEKHLFEGPFRFVDVGTGSGAFAEESVKYLSENFESPKIILTSSSQITIKDELKKFATIYDATRGPLAELILLEGPANIVITKDVMKFFDPETKDIIWDNVTSVLAKGGVIVDGSTTFLPYESAYKAHVLNSKRELVKIDFDKFINEYKKVKDYQDYLSNLDGILNRSAYVEEK